MFKRYKNPFEGEMGSSLFNGENGPVMAKKQGNHNQGHTSPAHSAEPQRSHYAIPGQEDYHQEVPPRIFDARTSQTTASQIKSRQEEAALSKQERSWDYEDEDFVDSEEAMQMNPEEPETTIGEGVTFKGTLEFQRFLRIDGCFEGELRSNGKLIIGPKGRVKSNLILREAIIEGYMEGNLDVTERVELRGNAQVHGDIISKFISVDEGVTIIGNVMVSPDDERLAPTNSLEKASFS